MIIKDKTKSAFTLIELLVVVAIIGTLATVSVIALNNARSKVRDAKRLADIKQIQTALEMYFNDNYYYPTTAEFASSTSIAASISGSTSTYLGIIPSAPNPAESNCTAAQNSYSYTSSRFNTYTLSSCLGNKTGSLNAGTIVASPVGIVNGTASAYRACAGDDAGVACCNNCNLNTALCVGGTYCGRDANCPAGQSCVGGTCATFACGHDLTIATLLGHTCNTGAPDYDKCTYQTLQIGTQCWMMSNMNIGTKLSGTAQTNNSILEKFCYGNSAAYCRKYGAHYMWNEAMQYSVVSGAQGICPSGWHIPTHYEFATLLQYFCTSLGNSNCATTFPQDYTTTGWAGSSGETTIFRSGYFGVNYNGYCGSTGSCSGADIYYSYLFSSDLHGSDPWYRECSYLSLQTYTNYGNASNALGIRCIKD